MPSVRIVGDSIMLASRRMVETALHGWNPTFDAVVGRSTAGGLAAVGPLGSRLGDAAVIELGTNDRTRGGFARRARELLELVHDTPLVVWVTVHGPPPVPPVNGVIRSLASRFPNTEVADWGAAVPPEGLQEDGLHPNHAGKLAMARLVERVLEPWRAAVHGRGDRACEDTARSVARGAVP
jgi:lysophospholipase L1-like esterase